MPTAGGIAFIAWVALVTLRGMYRPLGPAGLDPSWMWVINHASDAGIVFGRDVVFTYGPLGFLMWPLDISSNLLIANLFLLVVQLVFAVTLIVIFLREKLLLPVLGFGVLFVLAHFTGLQTEGFLLLVTGLLVLVAITENNRLSLALASVITAILLLVKMSLGVAAIVILAAGLLTARFVFRRSADFAVPLCIFPVILALLTAAYFGGVSTFLRWLAQSWEVVSGYSVANSVVGPSSQTMIGAAVAASWLVATVLLRREPRLLSWYVIMAPVVVIQFRLAFVRQDGHQMQFIPFMLAAASVSVLLNRRPLAVAAHCAIVTLLLFFSIVSGLSALPAGGRIVTDVLLAGSGRTAVKQLIHFRETRDRLASESQINFAPLRLPEGWNTVLRGSRNGVGILPWETQYCPANDLVWSPTPTLQLYSAYTQSLDLESARHYASDAAPQFIINELTPVGDRHQMLDAPATWRALFIHYRARNEWVDSGMGGVLLERRTSQPRVLFEEIARDTIDLEGTALRVPDSDHLVFADLDLRLNALGRLQKSLFRVPKIEIFMHHASGYVTTRRLIPGTAINGVLINRFPRDGIGYIRLWQGAPDDTVLRFNISGPGSPLFHRTVNVRWRSLEIAAPTGRSSAGPRQTEPAEPNQGSAESR